MEPERLFSFTWHPYAIDPAIDCSILVEFHLEPTADGTLLRITESGFSKIPEGSRPEAFRMNSEGCTEQLENVARHVG
jgi:uncharacterized protein YndB with AHSA1/START domain